MRAAYVKYANNSELPTLADKLDHMIKNKLVPNAGKTKAKTVEDEVSHSLNSLTLSLETIQDWRTSSRRVLAAANGVPVLWKQQVTQSFAERYNHYDFRPNEYDEKS